MSTITAVSVLLLSPLNTQQHLKSKVSNRLPSFPRPDYRDNAFISYLISGPSQFSTKRNKGMMTSIFFSSFYFLSPAEKLDRTRQNIDRVNGDPCCHTAADSSFGLALTLEMIRQILKAH